MSIHMLLHKRRGREGEREGARRRKYGYPFLEKLVFCYERNDDPWNLSQENTSYKVSVSYQTCL
jgi:hypothetical protein